MKTVNADMMKRLVRQLVALTELFSQILDSDLTGFNSQNAEQGYETLYLALQTSLDQRIHDQIEEEGGVGTENLALIDAIIDHIDGTEFQEVEDEE